MLAEITIAGMTGAYAAALCAEWRRHRGFLARIPIRIHVNGTRGKSTTTRLIAAGLRAGGISTIAKTTGTTPRMILPDGSERPIIRPGDPMIREQIGVIEMASRYGVQAVVLECMAVTPENQWICEHKIIQSQIGVITNVRLDHCDIMGGRLDQIASCLANTIPRGGKLVTAETEYVGILEDRAESLGAVVHRASPEKVSEDDLAGFDYAPFRENVAVALEVCGLLGVDRNRALRGMQKALPDPGALQACKCEFGEKRIVFVNALAANDITSTRQIWDVITAQYAGAKKVLLLCSRRDRLARNADFVQALCSGWDFDLLILTGESTAVIRRCLISRGVARAKIIDLGRDLPAFAPGDVVSRLGAESVVVAAGNIVGLGETIANFFFERGVHERLHPDTVAGISSLSHPV